jgi:aminoglycoside phosphotransferase (APT) family kinase protein
MRVPRASSRPGASAARPSWERRPSTSAEPGGRPDEPASTAELGLAAVVHAANGRYFVKAAPSDSPAARLYEREMAANQALSFNVPAPQMRYSSSNGGWLVMAFDYLDVRDADLSPGSPDLEGVLAFLATISAAPTWDAAPPVEVNVTALQDKADALLSKQPGGLPWDLYRVLIEGIDIATLAGDRLVHYDLHPGNLKTAADGDVMAVDWAFACTGAPWVDAVLLVPRLIDAGHSPVTAERLMSRLPAWRTAPVASVTALAALWTIFRECKALYGPEDARAFRRQAARSGRCWVEYRMC